MGNFADEYKVEEKQDQIKRNLKEEDMELSFVSNKPILDNERLINLQHIKTSDVMSLQKLPSILIYIFTLIDASLEAIFKNNKSIIKFSLHSNNLVSTIVNIPLQQYQYILLLNLQNKDEKYSCHNPRFEGIPDPLVEAKRYLSNSQKLIFDVIVFSMEQVLPDKMIFNDPIIRFGIFTSLFWKHTESLGNTGYSESNCLAIREKRIAPNFHLKDSKLIDKETIEYWTDRINFEYLSNKMKPSPTPEDVAKY